MTDGEKLDRLLELAEAAEERRVSALEWQRQRQLAWLELQLERLLTPEEQESGLVYIPAPPRPWWRFW